MIEKKTNKMGRSQAKNKWKWKSETCSDLLLYCILVEQNPRQGPGHMSTILYIYIVYKLQ